jgi:hypothetical protein
MPGDSLDYLYTADRDSWEAWKDGIPREQTIEQRLNDLRDIDRRFDLRELTNTTASTAAEPDALNLQPLADALRHSEQMDIALAALQIRRRCMTALPAARTNGCDKAADEINEIKQVADAILDIDE